MFHHARATVAAASSFALVSLLLQSGQAQNPTVAPERPTAERPVYEIELQGPAAWRAMFSPTNLGSFLGSEKGTALWQGAVSPVDAMLQKLLALEDRAYQDARSRLLDYAGTLSVQVHGHGDAMCVLLVLGPDGRTDLTALSQDLANLASRYAGVAWQDGVDGGPRTLPLTPDSVALAPIILGDDPKTARAISALTRTSEVPAARTRVEAASTAAAETKGPRRPAFSLRIDVAAVLKAENAVGDASMTATMGLDSLRDLEFAILTAGPHVVIDLAQNFEGDRGLFEVLFPDTGGIPQLAALKPPDSTLWKVGHCDLAAIDRVVRKAAAARGVDGTLLDADLAPEFFDEKVGILPHFTSAYALFGTADGFEDVEDGEIDFGIAFRIEDHAAFAGKWQAARKELGLTELDSETKDGGYVVQRLGGFFQVHCAIGPHLFVLGYGKGIEDQIAALVARAQAMDWTASTEPTSLPKDLQRAAPKGVNGQAEGKIAVLLSHVVFGLETMRAFGTGASLPLDDLDEFDPAAVDALLKEHHLDVGRSATGFDQGRWHHRVYW